MAMTEKDVQNFLAFLGIGVPRVVHPGKAHSHSALAVVRTLVSLAIGCRHTKSRGIRVKAGMMVRTKLSQAVNFSR